MSKIADFIGNSARSNVEAAIKKAREIEPYNAIISLSEDRALQLADAVDRGEVDGSLAGVPFIVKDNFLTLGAPTTAASKMLENFQAPLQAAAVEKLEAQGAICIGKANLDSFAHGGSTETSVFGASRNSKDIEKVAGGSSGGSAVVTALDVVPFALGTDTGGSIRQPASFNGVIGVKPTYGAVSRYGVVAMASSTDTVGCFTTNADDAAVVMSVIAGRDARDMTTLPDFFVPDETVGSQKVGLIKEYMSEDVDPDVRRQVSQSAQKMRDAGHVVEEVSLPSLRFALAMYYVIVAAEVSSNLARYDGIRFGHRAKDAKTLEELYGRSRDEGFTTESKRRIMIGSYVLSSGYFDEYYQQAQKARTVLINQFNDLFSEYDILIGPVAPTTAFKLGEDATDPIKMYLADAMTAPPSLAGLPALSVPAGVDSNGMPVGIQLIAQQKQDAKLLALAKSLEEQ